jgi:hypothetical protein
VNRPLRHISARIELLADGQPVDDLSPCERLYVSHAIAGQAASLLAEEGYLAHGHRLALIAHFVGLTQSQGEDGAAYMAAVLSAMVGARTILGAGADIIDWRCIELQ